MDLFTKIVDLTMILFEKIGVANIPILSRPHVLVEVLVQFRAMRLGEITHMPLLGKVFIDKSRCGIFLCNMNLDLGYIWAGFGPIGCKKKWSRPTMSNF
jgi:hypothetical protein